MKKVLCFSLLVLMVSASGCGHKKVTYDAASATRENEKDGLAVQVEWIKNKKEGVDILLFLSSSYKEDLTIPNSSYLLELNGVKYPLRNSEGEMTLKTNVQYQKVALFTIANHNKKAGTITLHIDPITKDGKKVPPLKMSLELPAR